MLCIASHKVIGHSRELKMASKRVTKEQALKSAEDKIDGLQRHVRESLASIFDVKKEVEAKISRLEEESANVKATMKRTNEIKESFAKDMADVANQQRDVDKSKGELVARESEFRKQVNLHTEREKNFAQYEADVTARFAAKEDAIKKANKKLEADIQNLNDLESKHRSIKMGLNLREGDCQKKEDLLAKHDNDLAVREAAVAEKEKKLELARKTQIETEHKLAEIQAREKKVALLEKEIENTKIRLQKLQTELNHRETEIKDKFVHYQDIEADLNLKAFQYGGQDRNSKRRMNAIAITNFNNAPANDSWMPVREFLASVEDVVKPLDVDMLLKLTSVFHQKTYIRCPTLSFEVGIEHPEGRIDVFACGHGESPSDTANNTITEMRKKIKEHRGSARNPSRATSHKGPPV